MTTLTHSVYGIAWDAMTGRLTSAGLDSPEIVPPPAGPSVATGAADPPRPPFLETHVRVGYGAPVLVTTRVKALALSIAGGLRRVYTTEVYGGPLDGESHDTVAEGHDAAHALPLATQAHASVVVRVVAAGALESTE